MSDEGEPLPVWTGPRTGRFTAAAALLDDRIRKVAEKRGFAAARLLTRWAEVVGPDVAAIAVPVGVAQPRGQAGATLTLLCPGPAALRLEMEAPRLVDRINQVYGFAAIGRIRLRQTSHADFASAQATAKASAAPSAPMAPAAPPPDVSDTELRLALGRLAANVRSRTDRDRP